MEHQVVHMVVIVACAGVFAQWVAWRFRFPAIVVLTTLGLVLGPATNLVDPEAVMGDMLRPFVQLAVAMILFEGGLNLHWHELKETGKGVRRLVSAGLVLSFTFGSLAAHYVGGLSWPVATVFGAIIVVTGPTVIMPLLRQARLRSRTASILKWEGIVNDPLGALLAVVLFEYWVSSGVQAHGLDFGEQFRFEICGQYDKQAGYQDHRDVFLETSQFLDAGEPHVSHHQAKHSRRNQTRLFVQHVPRSVNEKNRRQHHRAFQILRHNAFRVGSTQGITDDGANRGSG